MMNEPHFGYIGHLSLHEFDYNTHLHLGDMRKAPIHREVDKH